MYLCCASPLLRKNGILVLEKSKKFHAALMEKLPSDRSSLLKTQAGLGVDTFERLSTFHAGTRVSMYQKNSRKTRDVAQNEKKYISIYDIMLDQGQKLIKENYMDQIQERNSSRLVEMQKRQKLNQLELLAMETPLLYVAQSTSDQEKALWDRCFTPLLRCLLEFANHECLQSCFSGIWIFLQVLQPALNSVAGELTIYRAGFLPTVKKVDRPNVTIANGAIQNMIDYWRLCASFAYVCMGDAKLAEDGDASNVEIDAKPFLRFTAAELNRNVLPLLSSEKHEIRKAAVASIGCIQSESYKVLLRDLQPYLAAIVAESNSRIKRPITASESAFERMRTQLTHLLTFVANITKDDRFRKSPSMKSLVDYIRAMIAYLSDHETQLEWKHQITRFYFCSFIEKFYRYLIDSIGGDQESVEKYVPFHTRRVLFSVFEGWCGYGVDGEKSRQKQANMMAVGLETGKDISERAIMANKMDVHRRSLQLASLKAMAALCRGPLRAPSETDTGFDLKRKIAWINGLLESPIAKYQQIARTTIGNIITYNPKSEQLLLEIYDNCYSHSSSSNLTHGYFLGLVDVISRRPKNWSYSSRSVALALFHLASPNVRIRKGASALLQHIEDSFYDVPGSSKDDLLNWYQAPKPEDVVNFDDEEGNENQTADPASEDRPLSITSLLPSVYKRAQIITANRLASIGKQSSAEFFSEITFRIQNFDTSSDDDQKKAKNLLLVAAPWLTSVPQITGSFQLDRSSNLTESEAITWTILHNLFYLTAKCFDFALDEIEALWKALLSTTDEKDFKSEKNSNKETMLCIVDFLVLTVFSLQSSKAIMVAKNIAVFLSRCESGGFLVQHVMSKISPDNLIPISDSVAANAQARDWKPVPGLYFADLSDVALSSNSSSMYSLCYLYHTLLVDVVLEMDKHNFILHLPTLLTMVFTQLDASASRCEEMRVTLVSLLQSILATGSRKNKRIGPILVALNLKEGKSMWKYEDPLPNSTELESSDRMSALALEVLDMFQDTYPQLQDEWGAACVNWGSKCPDNHVACRSLQLFRAIKPKLNQNMVQQLAESLHTSVSDNHKLVQYHCLDLLLSLKYIAKSINAKDLIYNYPQLFWISLSLLSSVNEWEYQEGLEILKQILEVFDISQQSVINSLMSTLPSKWPGGFAGLFIPLSRGLQSSKTEALALHLINSLLFTAVPVFLDTRPAKFLFVTLANLPNILMAYDYEGGTFERGHSVIEASIRCAETLASACQNAGTTSLTNLLTSFSQLKIKKREVLLQQLASIIRDDFPMSEGQVVKFALSLLVNSSLKYPNSFLSLLEILLQDQSQRPNTQTLPEESNCAWLRPLLALLKTPLASRASRLLDILLTTRLRATEEELNSNVGGPQNMYAYIKKPRNDTFTYLPSGWLLEDVLGEGSVLCKKRIGTVSRSFVVVPVNSFHVNNPPARMMLQFAEFENFYCNVWHAER